MKPTSYLYFLPASLLLLAASTAFPQAVSVAKWKNDAAAAYTVTMDDFCADHITGIQNYADTMFYNRGMPMAFGALMGDCDEKDWGIAERMIGHGHELMNHSWSHTCGQDGLDWCKPYWGEDKYALEIDKSTQVAEDRLKIKIRFFIFPYDVWEPSKLVYLEKKGYLGARSGIKGALTPGDFRDGFNLNFDVNWPRSDANRWQQQKYTLNGYVDEAISKGGWAIRETHGVNDSSWGYLLPDELREHLDFAKQKVDLGLLWVSGPTAVLKYQKVRDALMPEVQAEKERMVVHFNKTGLDTSVFDAPITFNLTIPADFPAGFQVYQQGKSIEFVRKAAATGNGSIRFDAYPHRGPVVVTTNPFLAIRDGKGNSRKPSLAYSPHTNRIHYRLGTAGYFRLDLLTPEGRIVRSLAHGVQGSGTGTIELDRSKVRPGLYFLRIHQAGMRENLRVFLLP